MDWITSEQRERVSFRRNADQQVHNRDWDAVYRKTGGRFAVENRKRSVGLELGFRMLRGLTAGAGIIFPGFWDDA